VQLFRRTQHRFVHNRDSPLNVRYMIQPFFRPSSAIIPVTLQLSAHVQLNTVLFTKYPLHDMTGRLDRVH